jgi:pimeloyl-ACP methyl ester carboxylesterase
VTEAGPRRRVRASDGTALSYAASGAGPPLALLMGLGLASSALGQIATRLAVTRRVLTVDYPGVGGVERPRGWLSTSRLADGVMAVLDDAGLEAADVFGVSFGGMVAQEVALRHPDRVRRLVLGCTTAGGRHAVLPRARLLAAVVGLGSASGDVDERLDRLLGLLLSPGFVARERERQRARAEALLAAVLPTPLARPQLAAMLGHDAGDRLPGLRVQTLVLHGTGDRLVPVVNAVRLAAAIPRAELRLYDGAGHAFLAEVEEEVLAELDRFLDRPRDTPPGMPPLPARRGLAAIARHGRTAVARAGQILRVP